MGLVALVGCGGSPPKREHQVKKVVKQERSEARQALERVRKSSLPKDAKKELEEAQKLIDKAGN